MALQDATGGHVVITGGTAPTAAAGSNNGTSPPAPVVAAASCDARGRLTFGSGSSPALGNQVVVTFSVPYSVTPVVQVVAENAATGLLIPGVASVTPAGFTLITAVVPTASQAATVYAAAWQVLG